MRVSTSESYPYPDPGSSSSDWMGVEPRNVAGERYIYEAAGWLRWLVNSGDPDFRYVLGALFAELGSAARAAEWWSLPPTRAASLHTHG